MCVHSHPVVVSRRRKKVYAYLVAEELGACPEQVWHDALAQGLKAGSVLRWDAVPVLGGPVVQVVHTVQVHVLSVPARGRMGRPVKLQLAGD